MAVLRRVGALAVVLLAVLLWAAAPATPARAQAGALQKAITGAKGPAEAGGAAPEAGQPLEPAAIEARRQEAANERGALEAQRAAAGEGAPAPGLATQIDRLQRLERLYSSQLEALAHEQRSDELRAEAERALASGPEAALGAPPYPLARLDELLDAQLAAKQQRPALEAATAEAEKGIADARRLLGERESARRAAKEAAELAEDDAARAAARSELRLAELASAVARERVVAGELGLANARADLEVQRLGDEGLAAQIAFVEERLALTEADIEPQLAAIEQREFAIRDEQPDAARAVETAERRLAAVQKRVDAEAQPAPALLAELEARRIGLLATQRRAAFLAEELERLTDLRRLVQGRAMVLSGEASREQIRTWRKELANLDADRERDARLVAARRADVEREAAAVQARLAGPQPEAPAAGDEDRWLREQQAGIASLQALAGEQGAGLLESQRASSRLARALGGIEKRATVADHLAAAAEEVQEAWDYELLSLDDRSVTVGKVTSALLIFVLGLLASRFVSRGLVAIVRRRSALDEGALTAIQSLAFYFLVALFFLIALRSVNIPLTAFTVAGGALAIGVGFGSQTIISNFVSGLILMLERPIKVGDLIEFDGATGRVERIGTRSTRIRTADNVHVIVPNSRLLENNVVNWTFGDDVVRTSVQVNVGHGSPTREVERILLACVDAQPDVLKHPKPLVLFHDFTPPVLVFHAEFWLKLTPLVDGRVVRSEIRHAIDAELWRHGITQRDVPGVAAPAPPTRPS